MMELFAQNLREKFPAVKWKDNFVLSGPGHTRAAHACATTRNGADTAAWYAAGRLYGMIDEEWGLAILDALESLQVKDPSSHHYGCMRWYAEEPKIEDSNGAFFVQMPLATLMTRAPQCLSDAERAKLLEILSCGGHWFASAAETGPIHYPNKILSDGGMTLAIARLTDDDALYARGCAFFRRWIRYTDGEGWGWGEHMSIGYAVIIFSALQLARLSLRDAEADIKADLTRLMDDMVELHRFFDGHEMTPAIRNYNYGGEERRASPLFNLAGVPHRGVADTAGRIGVQDIIKLYLLFDGEFYLTEEDRIARGMTHTLPVPRTRVTHILHENEAYSWVGKSGSIGSINNFPVLKETYQHKTWGLGWQSMPLCAAIYGERLLYTRFVVDAADGVRIHPRHCYLSPALFAGDPPYPCVRTRCRQADNAVLAFRIMEGINTDARSITDEWYIPRGRRHTPEITAVGDFTLVKYPDASLILAPLGGGAAVRKDEEDGAIRLSVLRASSDTGHITLPELGGGWAVVLHDAQLDSRTPEAHAADLTLTEEIGREPHFTDRVTLADGGKTLLSWDFTILEESTR